MGGCVGVGCRGGSGGSGGGLGRRSGGSVRVGGSRGGGGGSRLNGSSGRSGMGGEEENRLPLYDAARSLDWVLGVNGGVGGVGIGDNGVGVGGGAGDGGDGTAGKGTLGSSPVAADGMADWRRNLGVRFGGGKRGMGMPTLKSFTRSFGAI